MVKKKYITIIDINNAAIDGNKDFNVLFLCSSCNSGLSQKGSLLLLLLLFFFLKGYYMKSLKKYTYKSKPRRFKYTKPNSKVKNKKRKRKNKRRTKKRRKRSQVRKKTRYQSGGSVPTDPLQNFYEEGLFERCPDDEQQYYTDISKFFTKLESIVDTINNKVKKVIDSCIIYNSLFKLFNKTNSELKKKEEELEIIQIGEEKTTQTSMDFWIKLPEEKRVENASSIKTLQKKQEMLTSSNNLIKILKTLTTEDLNQTYYRYTPYNNAGDNGKQPIVSKIWTKIEEYFKLKETLKLKQIKQHKFILEQTLKTMELNLTDLKIKNHNGKTVEYLDTMEQLEPKFYKIKLIRYKDLIREQIPNIQESTLKLMLGQGRDPFKSHHHHLTGYNRVIVFKINNKYIVFTTMARDSRSIYEERYVNTLYNVIYPKLLTLDKIKAIQNKEDRKTFEAELLKTLNNTEITHTGPVLVNHTYYNMYGNMMSTTIKFNNKHYFNNFMEQETSKITELWGKYDVNDLLIFLYKLLNAPLVKNDNSPSFTHNLYFVRLKNEILPSFIPTGKTWHPNKTLMPIGTGGHVTYKEYKDVAPGASTGEYKVPFGGVLFFELKLKDDKIVEMKDLTNELGIPIN